MEIADRVNQLIENYLEEHGIELVDITYRRDRDGMVLRLLVDKPEGIKISECEELNNFLSEALDKENVINERHILEVSSPGLDRPMKTDRDFTRAMGKVLDVTTYEPIDGRKMHEGRLIGLEKEHIVIESGEISTVIPRGKIARAVLKIEF